ncbi:MAG TPA: hypothetical protein VGQ12_07805 [Candidatus Angelobacter sp.]|jgi:hypothetical protein|nr:hypothetical protein [Candidatus Angelobacter sp.]
MADRYRKGESERVNLNCKVDAETKLYLINLAGEFGLGHAVEQIVQRDRKRNRRPTKAQQHFATP